jgi:hypothetical protein
LSIIQGPFSVALCQTSVTIRNFCIGVHPLRGLRRLSKPLWNPYRGLDGCLLEARLKPRFELDGSGGRRSVALRSGAVCGAGGGRCALHGRHAGSQGGGDGAPRECSPSSLTHTGPSACLPLSHPPDRKHGSQLPYARTTVRSEKKLDHCLTLLGSWFGPVWSREGALNWRCSPIHVSPAHSSHSPPLCLPHDSPIELHPPSCDQVTAFAAAVAAQYGLDTSHPVHAAAQVNSIIIKE